MMTIGRNAGKAILIGTLCSVSYLAVYFARNTLSAVTPQCFSAVIARVCAIRAWYRVLPALSTL